MKVTQCCCCCSLRTGSLIIFWLQVFGGALLLCLILAMGVYKLVLACFIIIGVGLYGIIGTKQKKPVLLKPYIVMSVTFVIGISLLMLVAFLCVPSSDLLLVELCFAVLAVLEFYSIVVVYSYYCQLRAQIIELEP